MTAGGLQIAWYYHLPAVCSDAEVDDLCEMSLLPLLRVHRSTGRKVVLAVTGALLERTADVRPEALEMLRELIRTGVCEIAGTFYHDIFAPIVPFRYLRRHIALDVDTKKARLDVTPTVFFPANFTWISILRWLLAEVGYESLIIDEDHYVLATSTQLWRWTAERGSRMKTYLHPTFVDRRELHRPYAHPVDGGASRGLTCYIRDGELGRRVSFGTTGAIHRPLEAGAIRAVAADVAQAVAAGGRVTIADDGDRINPVSISGYEAFLEHLPDDAIVWPRDNEAENAGGTELMYLPSFSIAGVREFWLHDLDAWHYVRLLDEVYGTQAAPAYDDEIMELQDVFFLFWKTVPRKLHYLERLYAVLRATSSP